MCASPGRNQYVARAGLLRLTRVSTSPIIPCYAYAGRHCSFLSVIFSLIPSQEGMYKKHAWHVGITVSLLTAVQRVMLREIVNLYIYLVRSRYVRIEIS